jgi:hypothetical protein
MDINDIFISQKTKLALYKEELAVKDSLIEILNKEVENHNFDKELTKRLDLLENWTYHAAMANTWIYYSWTDSLVYAVDLSQYFVRKNDTTGDIYFLRSPEPIDPVNDKQEPPREWQKEIIEPKRPVVKTVPIKL